MHKLYCNDNTLTSTYSEISLIEHQRFPPIIPSTHATLLSVGAVLNLRGRDLSFV